MSIKRENISLQKIILSPTKYKIVNETGIFEVYVYLNNNYKICYEGHIKTKDFDVSGTLKLQIYRNGNVCIWYEYPFADYQDRGLKKYSTGFIIDSNKREEICDYIDALQKLSDYMKEKHLKRRYQK